MERIRKNQVTVSFARLGTTLLSCPFFIATEPCEVIKIAEVHETAEGGPLTAQIKRAQGATSLITAGDDILAATIDLNGAVNTVQEPALLATGVAVLDAGDRLGVKPSAGVTTAKEIAITATLELLKDVRRNQFTVSYVVQKGGGGLADIPFFVATEPCKVIKITEVHEIADGGAITATINKASGNIAVGAVGAKNLLSADILLNGTAGTVQEPALTVTTVDLSLLTGDKLGFIPSAAGAAIDGMVVTVTLEYE